MNESFIRFAGWSAYVNAAMMILSIVTLIIFFAAGGLWGRINDSVSVIWALSFVPLAVVLYLINRVVNWPVSLAAAVAGISALLFFAFLQSLLILGLVRYEQTLAAIMIMTGIIGLFLLLNGILARGGQTVPGALAWLVIIFGLLQILGSIGFLVGGPQNLLAAAGFLAWVTVGPIWAIWMGKLLLNDRLFTTLGLSVGNT